MSFDDKIRQYFINPVIKLSSPPAKHLLHLYADYVELVSVFSNQNFVSAAEILDRLSDEGVIHKVEKSENQAEENDRNEAFVKSFFDILLERVSLFGEDYPFIMRGNDKVILRQSADITDKHRIYIFLLLSSSLNLFGEFQTELTKEFEMVCTEVLKTYLPSHAVIKSFGKNSDYTGTAEQKIKELANDLRVTVNQAAIDQISKRGNQERGLDLIGWIPFEDEVPNLLSILAQCACGKEWYNKLNETARYENYYHFHGKEPLHAMFVPYSLVNYQRGQFYQFDEIRNRLIFERKRILNFIIDPHFFSGLESSSLVEKCLTFEEDIV